MKKIFFLSIVLVCLLIGEKNIVFAEEPPYLSIDTIPKPEGNWVYIQEGSGEMVIKVTTRNVQRIKVWIVPTGTQTWDERKLLCDQSGNKDFWTCIWRYTAEETIHYHVVIHAVGRSGVLAEILNVTRRHSQEHSPSGN
jgi:hypothetical protein